MAYIVGPADTLLRWWTDQLFPVPLSLPESSLMRTTNLGELCRICFSFLSRPFGGWSDAIDE